MRLGRIGVCGTRFACLSRWCRKRGMVSHSFRQYNICKIVVIELECMNRHEGTA